MMSSASKRASELRANQARQNSTTAAVPSTRRPSGAGDVSSKMVSSVRNWARRSASWRLKASLKWSMVARVACTGDGIGTSDGEKKFVNRNKVTTKEERRMGSSKVEKIQR